MFQSTWRARHIWTQQNTILRRRGKHLAAVAKYNDGDVFGAEKDSEQAWVVFLQLADGKSAEAHQKSTMAVKMKPM